MLRLPLQWWKQHHKLSQNLALQALLLVLNTLLLVLNTQLLKEPGQHINQFWRCCC